jgi:hypothetical protein
MARATIEHVGRIPLSASRRLSVTVRTEAGESGPVIDVRLQIADGSRWCPTAQAVRLEADRIGELVSMLERAIQRLPQL